MKILVIRRDNIGDLVCTTPLFSALRRHFPEAHIVALVNSYNAPVLDGNPDVDEVCAYRKSKHRSPGESRLCIWLETWLLLRRLRSANFDVAIVATPTHQPVAIKFANWVRAKRVIAFCEESDDVAANLPQTQQTKTEHETEAVIRLLRPLGINEAPGPVRITAIAKQIALIPVPEGSGLLVALHISARKPAQRWPIERYADLAHALNARYRTRFLLFWSPGTVDNSQHPGDDEKAKLLTALCHDLPLLACPTHQLTNLIAGLARCDQVICSDGGAMHLAAGLGKPIVCFFGNSGAQRWRPWGVPHELLQPESKNVTDISVLDALTAFERLQATLALLPPGQQDVSR